MVLYLDGALLNALRFWPGGEGQKRFVETIILTLIIIVKILRKRGGGKKDQPRSS